MPTNCFWISDTQQSVAWTHSLFTMKVALDSLGPQKCATCPSRSVPPALWLQTEFGSKQCWASQGWLSVRCCRSRPRSTKTLTGLPSSPSSSLCEVYFLIAGNWGIWCCSWGRPRSRGPKSSGCSRSRTQFSLRCAQPWRQSAGLPSWSRCRKSKLLSSCSLLPSRTRRRRTSTLFRWGCLENNWLQAVWVSPECSLRGSWRGLRLRLKCSLFEFRWGRAVWVWKSRSLWSAISVLRRWDWFGGRSWGCLRSRES